MEREVEAHGNVVTAVASEEPGTATQRAMTGAGIGPSPLIEISDKDYRSFCWPCYALEETGDCEPG